MLVLKRNPIWAVCLGLSVVCAGEADTKEELLMPSLDIHGSMGMGYYSIGQASPADSYSGLGLGYYFRPSIYAMSSISSGDYTIDAVSGLTIKPTASLLNAPVTNSQADTIAGAVGFNLVDSASANFSEWTLAVTHPSLGRFEAGRSMTVSAKSAMASFSPFHRLRGGYEDAVTAYAQGLSTTPTDPSAVAPLVTYFGATAGLLDAPHVAYATPDLNGLTLTAEYAPSDYLGDIGGLKKNAYSLTAVLQKECGDWRYDLRGSYANNVLNGYPDVTYANAGQLLTPDALVFGSQINASFAVGYRQWDASVSYGAEVSTENPDSPVTGVAYDNIQPNILETTLGYSFENWGGITGLQATYTVANHYLEYVSPYVTSSQATMVGVGVGQFIGNMTIELRAQRYTTSNNLITDSQSANIFSLGTLYLF